MNEFERRALLGDKQAQEECTRQGIVQACPFCGRSEETVFKLAHSNLYAHKRTGKCALDGMIIYNLADWNTRPAPPLGRCAECAHRYKGHCVSGPCAAEETDADFYCRNFKEKENKDNALL